MEDDDIIKKINDKLNNLSTGKKLFIVVLMALILASIFYMTTIDIIQTFQYRDHGTVMCEETYINGILNTTPCPQNTDYFPTNRFISMSDELFNNMRGRFNGSIN